MDTEDKIVVGMIVCVLCVIAAWGLGIYVVWHFVTKYW